MRCQEGWMRPEFAEWEGIARFRTAALSNP